MNLQVISPGAGLRISHCRRQVCSRLGACAFLLILLTPLAGLAATYHVSPSGNDGNPGTLVVPWAAITKANTVLVAGGTVIIYAGNYRGQRIDPDNSGSLRQYINYNGAVDEAMPVTSAK